jgi:hypothetical protein
LTNKLRINFWLFCMSIILIGCDLSTLNETVSDKLHPLSTSAPTSTNLSIRQSLIAADNNCKLPCFMGLRSGETTSKDLKTLLENVRNTRFRVTNFDDGVIYETSLSQRSNGRLYAAFTSRNDQLDSMHIWLTQSSDWLPKNILLLPNLLNLLGEPDDVFILISGPPLSFTMVVVYNHIGVMVLYRAYFKSRIAHQLENSDDPFLICLTPSYVDVDYLEAWLIDPNDKDLVEGKIPDLRDSERDTRPYWSIEKMSGINTQQFTEFFTKNPQSCLETPSMKELRAAGYVF